jgi:hypothetical protein
MASLDKGLLLCLVIIFAATIFLTVIPANAQTIPKPSVPQFTVTLNDLSYDVPLTYSTTTDPYTGQQTTTSQGGYHVTNRTITIKIKNQHFTPITLENGTTLQLYYAIRYKGHFGQDWTILESSYMVSDGEYTEKTYVIATLFSHEEGYLLIPDNSQVDFQVQAIIGHYYTEGFADHPFYLWQVFSADSSSGWSNTRIIQTPEVIPSVSPMPLPSVPEFPITTFIVTVLVAASLLLVIGKRNQSIIIN